MCLFAHEEIHVTLVFQIPWKVDVWTHKHRHRQGLTRGPKHLLTVPLDHILTPFFTWRSSLPRVIALKKILKRRCSWKKDNFGHVFFLCLGFFGINHFISKSEVVGEHRTLSFFYKITSFCVFTQGIRLMEEIRDHLGCIKPGK